MVEAGSRAKVYTAAKIAATVEALAVEGVPQAAALEGVGVPPGAVTSSTTRVSIDQIIACYHNAIRLTRDPHFALHLGLKVHLSTYGLYGFALLSGTDFRKIMHDAVKYPPAGRAARRNRFPREGQPRGLDDDTDRSSAGRCCDVQVPG